MIKDGYRIGNKYDIDFEFDENNMNILINGATLAQLNTLKDALLVRLYDSTIPDCHGYVHKHKHSDIIGECPNCNSGMLYLRVPADMNYRVNSDGSIAMNEYDTDVFWLDFQELYCDNCGIDSQNPCHENGKLAYDFDEKNKKITAVRIIKKGEY